MLILVLGDPHFRKDNLDLMEQACNEIINIINIKKPDLVVCLGDTLDTHERIHLDPLYKAIKFFKLIATKCKLVILIGNHDRLNNSEFMTDKHPFMGLEDNKNIVVVYKTIYDKENNFVYVPYVPNGKFKESLKSINYENLKPRLIFAHQEFYGSDLGPKKSTTGDIWDPNEPLIISGHIHKYQKLKNIIYVGTFMQQNYGEDTDKAIMLIDINENNINFQRIKLNCIIERKTIEIDFNEIQNLLKTLHIYNNYKLKVIVNLHSHERKGIKDNIYFKQLKKQVDKIELKTKKENNFIITKNIDIENMLFDLLRDDPYSIEILKNEILPITSI